MKEANEHQQRQYTVVDVPPQPVVLSRKLSGERLSQTMHKDLNIHVESRAFEEQQGKEKQS